MQNPFKQHLSDDAYSFLLRNNLLREKGIRDFSIRLKYNTLKNEYPTYIIIEMLQKQFPYLQYETIRKIIYQKPVSAPIDINDCYSV